MPTTVFPIAVAGNDGSGYYQDTIWPPSGGTWNDGAGLPAELWVSKVWSGGDKFQDLAFLRFDTSSIPDNATITAASIDMYLNTKNDFDSAYTVAADFYDFGGEPTVAGDYVETASPSVIAAQTVTSLGGPGLKTFTVTDFSGISKTGITGFRFTLSAGIPTGNNYTQWASFEGTDQEPRLSVTYTVPADTPATLPRGPLHSRRYRW